MATDEVPPRGIAVLGGQAGGADDVGKEDRGQLAVDDGPRAGPRQELLDLVEERLEVARVERQRVEARELHVRASGMCSAR